MDIFCNTSFPPQARQVALAQVTRFDAWAKASAFGADLAGADYLAFPHRVFWLSYRDMWSSQPLRACADDRGWRFLLMHQENAAIVAAVEVWQRRGASQASSVRVGRGVDGWKRALTAAQAHDGGAGSFEPCFLWCRTNWTAALWLRPYPGGDGFVVPLPYAHAPLEAGEVIPGAEFLEENRKWVRNRRADRKAMEGAQALMRDVTWVPT